MNKMDSTISVLLYSEAKKNIKLFKLIADFDCGKIDLNNFLIHEAESYERSGSSKIYLFFLNNQLLGYYAICCSSVSFKNLPKKTTEKMPKHSAPSILLTRLAVDNKFKGKHYGELLLLKSWEKSIELSESIGASIFVVHALTEDVVPFYTRYGLESLPKNKTHLFISIDSIKEHFNRI